MVMPQIARPWAAWAALASVCVLVACGGGDGGAGDETAPQPSESYFPLEVGSRWVLNSREDRVVGTRIVRGINASVVQSRGMFGAFLGESLYAKNADGVRELVDDNDSALAQAIGPVEVMRFPLIAGRSFTQIDKTIDGGIDFDGDGRTETIALKSTVTVVGFERVDTPVGSFEGCAHVRTNLTQTARLTTDGRAVTGIFVGNEWYAPGIGLIKSDSNTTVDGRPAASSTEMIQGYAVGARRSDNVAPTVAAVSPQNGAVVGPAAVLSLTFSEDMDMSSLAARAFEVSDARGAPVPGTLQWQGRVLSFSPAAQWTVGTYSVRLGPGLTDRLGNPMEAPLAWQFTVDATGPTVVSVTPADHGTEVAPNAVVTVVFSEPVDPASASNGSVYLWSSQGTVAARVQVDGARVTLTPLAPLDMATNYIVDAWGVTDRAGNQMQAPFTSYFSTDAGRFSYPAALLGVGNNVQAVAIGDVNGDGRPDVLLATGFLGDPASDARLFVRLQQADGSLAAAVSYPTAIATPTRGASISVVDMDGDGRNDVVLGAGDGGIEVFRQGPTGSLTSALSLTAIANLVRVADLDNDGRPDLVSLAWGSNAVQVWWQQPGGGFTTAQTVAIDHAGWEDLELGDIDGDGRIDIVITSGTAEVGKSLAILRQAPGRTFAAPIYRPDGTPNGLWGVGVGDVDGDGRNDIVASQWGNRPTNISVFRQTPAGTLADPQALATYDIPGAIEIADMDQDGRADIVVVHNGWLAVGLYRQRADGSLGAEERFPAFYADVPPHALALGDVNGDGLRDIVVGDSVLLQKPLPAATALRAATPPVQARSRLRSRLSSAYSVRSTSSGLVQ